MTIYPARKPDEREIADGETDRLWPLCCLPSYHNMSWDLRGGPHNNIFVLLFSISKEKEI
jgi:hypothetical protein